MSFIGNSPDSFGYTSTSYEQFSGDNANTTFTLSKYVTNSSDIQVVVNNVIQEPEVAYSVTNLNSLVFTSPPSEGTDNIYVVYRNFIKTGLGFIVNFDSSQMIAANSISSPMIVPGAIQNYHFGNSSIIINDTEIKLGGSGSISGQGLDDLNAANLKSGTVSTERLGSGTANSITYLAGDSTWKTIPGDNLVLQHFLIGQ